ncbi:vomeronasal 1 receptor oryCunV1R1572 [Oryctolagus cuniculus]|uniref:vomeronasal 1 receptor oryCunV1R1572 n=1 Tax=Oryctolagus cuniculus TaxID=9986 RepID=UPI0001CE2C7E|nr:vomeronasal 1 receptor oryCunV1R1572 [Oryctolagus cuniculus]
MNKNKKDHTSDIRYTLFSEVGIGVSANTMLLLFHILTFFLQHRPKPLDLTIGLLALIHLVMLLIMGFLITDIFGSRGFWNDVMCKSVFYLYRILRGLSLCTTCLLSVLQAITLSPRSSCLAKFKQMPSHHSLCSLLFLWVVYVFITSPLIITTIATPNLTSDSLIYATEFCSIRPMSYLFRHMFSMLATFREVFVTGLMAVSSGYMVTLLCRHKRQSQHLHSTRISARATPEQRATCTILLLLCFFIFMSILDYIVYSSRAIWNNDPTLHCVHMLVINGYATVSPLVLISTEKRIITFLKSVRGYCVIIQWWINSLRMHQHIGFKIVNRRIQHVLSGFNDIRKLTFSH